MKILVLTGSPHHKGTTAYLADKFCEGAVEAGHEVHRVNTAKIDVKPCLGCDYCRRNDGECVYSDDMQKIIPYLLEADGIAFVSPLYYFGITAQIKRVIDRFYAVNSKLRSKAKKTFLISAGSDEEAWAMESIKLHFRTMCRYLNWQPSGELLVLGAATREDVEGSIYSQEAKVLGMEAFYK
ncbi:MAG TPA: flavodoxin family protein [Clostridiales bacterium]|jgi:multimeric flavodoxin WrbA|nr:flavodoxin family protein [Clostridiales bacterium]